MLIMWTKCTRFNQTHLLREDGYIFKPETFHFEELLGFLEQDKLFIFFYLLKTLLRRLPMR